MRRLAVLLLGTLAILSATDATALAQAADKVYRLGLLSPSAGTFERMRAGVLPELARLGFTEGKNLVVETRTGPTEQLAALPQPNSRSRVLHTSSLPST